MLALIVGAHRDRARARQARLRRRPAVERGAGRLHERPRDHDHRRPAAEAVRLLHRRRRLRRRAPRSSSSTSTRRKAAALVVGVGVLVVLLVLPRITTTVPAVLVAVVGATVVSAVLDLVGRHRDRRLAAAGLPDAVASRGRSSSDVGPLLIAAVGITLVSLTDTIATSSAFAARRGDEVDPNQEMIGIGAANVAAGLRAGVRGVDERLAHRGRRAVRREEPAHRRRRRRRRRRAPALPQRPARRPARSRRSPRW